MFVNSPTSSPCIFVNPRGQVGANLSGNLGTQVRLVAMQRDHKLPFIPYVARVHFSFLDKFKYPVEPMPHSELEVDYWYVPQAPYQTLPERLYRALYALSK
jgi:hypothetical protein